MVLALRNSILDSMLNTFEDSFFDNPLSNRSHDPVDISLDHDNNYYRVRAVVPGFSERELHVAIDNSMLTVSGKREVISDKKNYHASTRTNFSQSIRLGTDALTDNITAEHKDGILLITIPRKTNPLSERKSIPIKTIKQLEAVK